MQYCLTTILHFLKSEIKTSCECLGLGPKWLSFLSFTYGQWQNWDECNQGNWSPRWRGWIVDSWDAQPAPWVGRTSDERKLQNHPFPLQGSVTWRMGIGRHWVDTINLRRKTAGAAVRMKWEPEASSVLQGCANLCVPENRRQRGKFSIKMIRSSFLPSDGRDSAKLSTLRTLRECVIYLECIYIFHVY